MGEKCDFCGHIGPDVRLISDGTDSGESDWYCTDCYFAEPDDEISALKQLLVDLAQILDGWHADGTAWSEWDESVRQRLSEHLQQME